MSGGVLWRYALAGQARMLSMPRGSAPIVPRGSAFRICLWQIHGSGRRADARGLSHAEGRFCGDGRTITPLSL